MPSWNSKVSLFSRHIPVVEIPPVLWTNVSVAVALMDGMTHDPVMVVGISNPFIMRGGMTTNTIVPIIWTVTLKEKLVTPAPVIVTST